ncbi:MAG: hypothetical protein H6Q76_1384, partial [Firmicutes bacterium]|nr:hypothetical protein [Bacillota bacterium]
MREVKDSMGRLLFLTNMEQQQIAM